MNTNMDVLHRIERIERENKRWKFVALCASLIALGLVTMAQTRQSKTPIPRVIEAERFMVRDTSGNEVATLGVTDGEPALELKRTTSAKERTMGAPATFETRLTPIVLMISGTKSEGKSDLQMWLSRSEISFQDGNFNPRLKASSRGPSVEIQDEQGFKTTIGKVDLETVKTGESRTTSAASIVIFDREGKVIWKVPLSKHRTILLGLMANYPLPNTRDQVRSPASQLILLASGAG